MKYRIKLLSSIEKYIEKCLRTNDICSRTNMSEKKCQFYSLMAVSNYRRKKNTRELSYNVRETINVLREIVHNWQKCIFFLSRSCNLYIHGMRSSVKKPLHCTNTQPLCWSGKEIAIGYTHSLAFHFLFSFLLLFAPQTWLRNNDSCLFCVCNVRSICMNISSFLWVWDVF